MEKLYYMKDNRRIKETDWIYKTIEESMIKYIYIYLCE